MTARREKPHRPFGDAPPLIREALHIAALTVAVLAAAPVVTPTRSPGADLHAQEVFDGEVRQLVTFRFVPGRSADAQTIFRERALPLYRLDEAMHSFRAFREVESSIPLDLVVVSSFEGMAGMDEHNAALGALPGPDGRGIGGFYGEIGGLIAAHDDQFVEMLPALSDGDPSSRRRVALVWYRLIPGEAPRFERTLAEDLLPWERSMEIPSATGRFLLSDGWHYLRVVGFDSLAGYQAYWEGAANAGHAYLDVITTTRREVILAPVPELSVR